MLRVNSDRKGRQSKMVNSTESELGGGTQTATRKKRAARAPAAARSDMREKIKQVATELLISRGFNGTSYGDIATRLGVTTTNIHYHFGNKQALVDEVVADYVAEARGRHLRIWLDQTTSLQEKLQKVVEYNFERYRQFNPTDHGTQSWSLIGRLRLESDVLSEGARDMLASFTSSIHEGIRLAVDTAWHNGELRDDTPREDLAFLLINIVNSSSVFTHGTGGFDKLKLFFDAFSRVMLSAYAPDPKARRRSSK
ncbi:TetR/AcrR family transcriptional regulator [Burkholderia gladioli]|uniref:TetR/AcrR family transcriptional regulator n=1 Tax=Burkholderia gladioli TaxID=28095 RepID=UPI00265AEAF3|nr:TetR/AcrR family transcriptional regulator [Burkholderia gladioli]